MYSRIHFLSKVSSGIQNQDFTVVDDYISGLKTLLYMQVIIIITITIFIIIIWWTNKLEGLRIRTLSTMDNGHAHFPIPSP